MGPWLLVLLLATFPNGGIAASLLDNELAMLNVTCLTTEDRTEMMDYLVSGQLGKFIIIPAIQSAISSIAIIELRKSLQAPPLGPWDSYNHTIASDEDLQLAFTVQEYYALKERVLSGNGHLQENFSDENIDSVISFFDRRLPVIRECFRESAQNLRLKHQKTKYLDRKAVDQIVEDYEKNHKHVRGAVSRMSYNECLSTSALPWDDDYESPSTTAPVNVDEVLSNINASCVPKEDHQKLTGYKFKESYSTLFSMNLFKYAVEVMAIQELRATLKFEGVKYLKQYYLLKERQVFDPELDKNLVFTPPYISYFDQRFPMLRIMYQQKFEAVRGFQQINIQTIDRLINEYSDVIGKVREITDKMLGDREYVRMSWYVNRVCKNGTVVFGTEILR